MNKGVRVYTNKQKLFKFIRRLRNQAGLDYMQIEECIRIGLLSIKHGVKEKELEEQFDLKNKRILKERKELEKVLNERHENKTLMRFMNLNFFQRLKFLFTKQY